MDPTRFHQVVDRPIAAGPRVDASWPEGLLASDTTLFSASTFRARLVQVLSPVIDHDAVSASVLVGCFDLDGEVGVLLTRRAATMRSEPLTVSFPGGRREAGESALDAALREAAEEVGLLAEHIEVLGALETIERRRDRELVLPVVCWLHEEFTYRPNPDEVDEVLTVPLRPLVRDGSAWFEEWGEGAERRAIRFFADEAVLGRDLVWGLTARMIWQLLELVGESGAR